MKPILAGSGLKKIFGAGGTAVSALRDVDIELASGELVLIQGPSGSGKTSLLQVLGLLTNPTEGSLRVVDQDVTVLQQKDLAHHRARTFGFIFQDFQLIRSLTAVENVMLPLLSQRVSAGRARKQAAEQLEKLNLRSRAGAAVEELSGGEKQRVAIGRAIVHSPKIILADEPTANLDSENGKLIMQILKELSTSGLSVLAVSHDDRLVPFADRVLRMRDGRLLTS